MKNNNPIDLENLDVEQLRAITENAQQLIDQKQHQRLYDAYMQFEQIAEEADSSIDEILKIFFGEIEINFNTASNST